MARALRSNWAQIRRSWYIFAFQIPWLPEWAFRRDGARPVKDALRRSAKSSDTFTDADLDKYARAFSAPGAATAAINYYRAAVRSRVATGRIRAPTLLIWGEDDFALGIELTRGMDGLFEREPRVEYLPDTGHFVMEERPEAVNRLLLEFLV
jgi:epoxide hydrolase 4